MLDQENQSKLIEINNNTINSNFNTNRKGPENNLNNKQQNNFNSKNSNNDASKRILFFLNKVVDNSTLTFAKGISNFNINNNSNLKNSENLENQLKNETVLSLEKIGLDSVCNEVKLDSVRRRKCKFIFLFVKQIFFVFI
jgi:hypothetical protein